MYKLIKNIQTGEPIAVEIIGKNTSFLLGYEDNSEYQAYLEWLAEGNTPEPADE